MTTMPRFRRYRVFLICAVLMIVLIARFKSSDEWSSATPVPIELGKDTSKSNGAASSPSFPQTKEPHVDIEHLAHADDPPPLAPPPPKAIVEDIAPAKPIDEPAPVMREDPVAKPKDAAAAVPEEDPVATPKDAPAAASKDDSFSKAEDNSTWKPKEDSTVDPTKTVSQATIPDRLPLSPGGLKKGNEADDPLHPVAPGRKDPIILTPSSSPIHWKKQPEQFPVPTESLIHLPTGKPIDMRRIQFKFSDETPTGKVQRELRLGKVRAEFQKAWNGYKKFAWMHDELSPKTGTFRDPFCGWAATLIDSLDTLYIMGLEDDFVEAVAAVKDIDFTTCLRADLQVFEITIRYLGGLLGAYDISGHKHKILLDKAVELGEILIGVFDTPNRMPMLFYQWKPAFASQSHRASTRSSFAELGSLTVEFTRLAQLTKESKYYDAVARITNALVDWQKRGTRLPGVFPDEVDASGCNFTVPTVESVNTAVSDNNLGHTATMPAIVKEQKPKKKLGDGRDDLELQIIPGQPAKGSLRKVEKEEMKSKPDGMVSKRDLEDIPTAGGHTPPPEAPSTDATTPASPEPVTPEPDSETKSITASKTVPVAPSNNRQFTKGQFVQNSTAKLWDCVYQGLDSANSFHDHFSMGGSQDSTYEYFSKEYMLLGGQADNYRTLYINAMSAVRNHLLYRPMVPGNADILFSGKVTTSGNLDDIMFESEVTHLTCFLGGMVGMGAKLFDMEGDIEIAKKLTDGCVWAYSSMTAGVMAEESRIFPCQSVADCTWNETLWWQHLDPSWSQRDQMIKDYDLLKAKLDAQRENDRIASEARRLAEEQEQKQKEVVPTAYADGTQDSTDLAPGSDSITTPPPAKIDAVSVVPVSPALEDKAVPDAIGSMATPGEVSEPVVKLQRRQTDNVIPNPASHDFSDDKGSTPELPKTPGLPKIPVLPETVDLLRTPETPETPEIALTPQLPRTEAQRTQEVLDKKKLETEEELNLAATGRGGKQSPGPHAPKPLGVEDDFDPSRPLNHTAYVKQRIAMEGLKPGYLRINSDRYILRPEAIESVWYMYRITGDTEWQEKGWKMFEAVIASSTTTYGHSAVNGVATGKLEIQDQMESFWLAETLKYFYLLYTTPDTVSLDDWVLNTEAHPFRRPT